MRIDLDTYHEILDTLTRNKSRSLLTGFGVFWGVLMLVVLLGGGRGLREMLQKNFAGFATNTAMIWTQPTSKPYKGLRKGRSFSLHLGDMERLRQQVPELDVVTLFMFGGNKQAVCDEYNFTVSMMGVDHDFTRVVEPKIRYGRTLNGMDMRQQRKVCVIGKQVYNRLFPKGGDPCGQRIRIDSTYFQVVGVDYQSGGISIGGDSEGRITIPHTVFRRMYNRGPLVDGLAVTGRPGAVMSRLSGRMRAVLARGHQVDPTDEQGIMVFNTEVLFAMLDNLFSGVNFLVWLVGIGTLLAGSVGVSNIMMVTVKERTSEIGIRRAIGATPRMILSQIVAESVLLTTVAGMSGILTGVAILQMIELANTTDGVLETRFQVDFWTAVTATLLLCVLGGLAGLAPAWRAMRIKPVEAMAEDG